MMEPVFIIGCARSGTTIIGDFFQNNSQCVYFNEINIWQKYSIAHRLFRSVWQYLPNLILLRTIHYKVTSFLQDNNLMKEDKGHRLAEKDVTHKHIEQIKSITSQIHGKRLVVKHPRNSLRIPFIRKLFPNAKYVHVIRDGRDVTCSLMTKQGSGYWAHMKPPDWRSWQKKYPKGPKKYAWQWTTTIDIINSDKSKIPKSDFIEFKYEDFVRDAESTMKHIFDLLGIPFEKAQQDLSKKIQDKMENSYIGGRSLSTKIRGKSFSENWKI